MQPMHFQVRAGVFWVFSIVNKSWQRFPSLSLILWKNTNRVWFIVAQVKFHCFGINWHVFNQSECRSCCLLFRKSLHNPNLQSSFCPPGFSPHKGQEERRVQGLDQKNPSYFTIQIPCMRVTQNLYSFFFDYPFHFLSCLFTLLFLRSLYYRYLLHHIFFLAA